MRPLNLEPGQVFGRLTIVGLDLQSKYRKWVCDCSCGGRLSTTYANIVNGGTKSCGCLRKDNQSVINQKKRAIPWEADRLRYLRTLKKTKNRQILAQTWALDLQDYIELVTQNCHYCGAEPSQIPHGKGMEHLRRSGIDRKDPRSGYSVTNCVACCVHCNRAKLTQTTEEFESHTRKQYLHLKSKGLITT